MRLAQHMLGFTLLTSCWAGSLQPAVHWPDVLQELVHQPDHPELKRIFGGASNVNFAFHREGKGYFIRHAPSCMDHLFADIGVECEVLQALHGLNIAPELIHYEHELRILVSSLVEHDGQPVVLQDELTRRQVMAQLKRIEASGVAIRRSFLPYQHVQRMLSFLEEARLPPVGASMPQASLPLLQKIESLLQRQGRRCLCHLDLHNKNILRAGDQFWLVDWEYAMMGHPYLVLASMAAIERWGDAEMEQLARDFDGHVSQEELDWLFVHRIAIDLFWGVWNHIQAHTSQLDNPYEEWGRLFFQAANQRIQSPRLEETLNRLEQGLEPML